MRIGNVLWGRPLASNEEDQQKVGVVEGVPILGLDALASAAYGPEAALSMLIPLGVAGATFALPVMGVIMAALAILYFSYRQTQNAYPGGGGSYTVAKENLGTTASLLAAASLLIDYVLVVAVGISAGVGALVSAVPALHPYIVWLCVGLLVLITVVNLRGVRESALTFAVPTYGFILLLVVTIAWGVTKTVMAGGRPLPVEPIPFAPAATGSVSLWLLVRSFANGCTAMTGVEAVSNGMMVFREPRVKNAQRTLTVIIAVLVLLLAGIAYLASAYGILAMPAEAAGYQSVVSQLVGAVSGRGAFYYVTIGFVLAVLALSAQTGFADFPRLCRLLAVDDFLPHAFAARGRRLVYSGGIVVLALMSATLLVAFKGLTEGLIPLFAVGAFSAFTLSQAGMVLHWQKLRTGRWRLSLAISLVGCVSTAVALVVILAAKFREGAWIVTLLVPVLLVLFQGTKRHYGKVAHATHSERAITTTKTRAPIVIVPVQRWSSISQRALSFAVQLGGDVTAVHISHDTSATSQLKEDWSRYVEQPMTGSELKEPCLVILRSPYRHVLGPILDFIRETRLAMPDRELAVVIPELVETRWWQHLLHNQRALALKAALLFGGDNRTVVINIPWYADRVTR